MENLEDVIEYLELESIKCHKQEKKEYLVLKYSDYEQHFHKETFFGTSLW